MGTKVFNLLSLKKKTLSPFIYFSSFAADNSIASFLFMVDGLCNALRSLKRSSEPFRKYSREFQRFEMAVMNNNPMPKFNTLSGFIGTFSSVSLRSSVSVAQTWVAEGGPVFCRWAELSEKATHVVCEGRHIGGAAVCEEHENGFRPLHDLSSIPTSTTHSLHIFTEGGVLVERFLSPLRSCYLYI